MRKSKLLPIIAYIIMLIIILGNMPNSDYIVVENRPQKSFPTIDSKAFFDQSFQQSIEGYFSDQVISEKKLIEVKSQYEILIGNALIRNSVLIGDEMFFSNTTLSDMKGNLLTDDELNETIYKLDRISQFYNDSGYECYFAIGPNKTSIYPERLPSFSLATYRRLNQIEDSMNRLSFIHYIDLQSLLLEYKNQENEQIYFSYDSHWNHLGGYIVSEKLIEVMYPQNNFGYSDYKDKFIYDKVAGQDLANIIGVPDLYYDITYRPVEPVNYYKPHIETPLPSKDELIVIRDSFYNAVAPSFEYVDVSKNYIMFNNQEKEDFLPTKNTGKVLILVVERNIYDSINNLYHTLLAE